MAVDYGPGIDIWSTGCIFAELINRKPLYPGRDYINQLNLITDALGVHARQSLAPASPQRKIG